MIIHKEGDKSKAICEKCGKIVPVTFRYAEFIAKGIKVPEVLQGFCDFCDEALSLPHQSTFRIKEYREAHSHPLEFRVPSHYIDILLLIGDALKISRKPNLLCRLVSEPYLIRAIRPDGRALRHKIINALKDELANGKSRDRLSCAFPGSAYSALETISSKEHTSKTDIVRGIILTAKHDILDNRNRSISRKVEELATLD